MTSEANGDCIPPEDNENQLLLAPISETIEREEDGDFDRKTDCTESTLIDASFATSVKSIRLPDNTVLNKAEYKEFKNSLHQSQRHRIIESRRRVAEELKKHQEQLTKERQEMDHFERRVIKSFSERWSKQIPIGQKRPRGYSYSRCQSAGSVSLMGSYRIATGAGSAVPHYSRSFGSRRSFSAGAILPSSCMTCSARSSCTGDHEGHGRTIFGRKWSNAGLPQVFIYLIHDILYLYIFVGYVLFQSLLIIDVWQQTVSYLLDWVV
jgi:hypothetical protein